MKTRMLGTLTLSAVLCAALATTSVAQDRTRGFDGPRADTRGAGRLRGQLRAGSLLERFIERHDTNADGKVSEAEFVEARLLFADAGFEQRDRDDDGLISADEHAEPRGQRDRPGRARRGDRPARLQVDQAALTACVRETIAGYEPRFDTDREDNFDAADTDGDSQLNLTEISAAIEAQSHERFAQLDGDGDGFVTESELLAKREDQLQARRAVRACAREQLRG